MSRKTSSFLVPFSVSFASVSCIGLLVIYFAFYRPRFSSVESTTPSETSQLATLQDYKPAGPFGNPSFTVDETGVVRGMDQTEKHDSGKRPDFPAQRSASSSPKPTHPAIHNAKSTPAQEQSNSATARNNRESPGADSPKQEPAPATTAGSTTQNEKPADQSGESMKKPAQNDGGNNLMRALKEAGQRKQQNLSTSSDTPSGSNPFDSILKSRQSNTESDKEEEK